MASWVRTKITLALIKSMLVRLRLSPSIKSITIAINETDVQENFIKNQKGTLKKYLDNLLLRIRKVKLM